MHALVEQNTRLVSAQSTPLLMLDTSNEEDGKPVLKMALSNVGTGPAQIAWFRISDADGNDYSGSGLTERVEKLDQNSVVASQQISATFVRSGDQRIVFEWPKPVASPAGLAEWDKLNTLRFRLRASACYCSIFDECRTTEFGESRPKPVSSCESAYSRR